MLDRQRTGRGPSTKLACQSAPFWPIGRLLLSGLNVSWIGFTGLIKLIGAGGIAFISLFDGVTCLVDSLIAWLFAFDRFFSAQ